MNMIISKLKGRKKCSNCGSLNDTDATVCIECSSVLHRTRRLNKKLIIILSALLVAVVMFSGVLFYKHITKIRLQSALEGYFDDIIFVMSGLKDNEDYRLFGVIGKFGDEIYTEYGSPNDPRKKITFDVQGYGEGQHINKRDIEIRADYYQRLYQSLKYLTVDNQEINNLHRLYLDSLKHNRDAYVNLHNGMEHRLIWDVRIEDGHLQWGYNDEGTRESDAYLKNINDARSENDLYHRQLHKMLEQAGAKTGEMTWIKYGTVFPKEWYAPGLIRPETHN